MSHPRSILSRLPAIRRTLPHPRYLTTTPRPAYDGVYKELTAMKVQKPWLRALAERDAAHKTPPQSAPAPNLTPKHMRDSYHSLVTFPSAAARPYSF